jgi:hypothetical protein
MDGRTYYFQNNTTGDKNFYSKETKLPLSLMPGTRFHIACVGGKLRTHIFIKDKQ